MRGLGHVARRRGAGLLLALVAAALAAALQPTTAFRLAELRAFDLISTVLPASPAEPGAVIVAIDEPSFAEFGERWPWSRAKHARLIEALRRAGAGPIGLDILLAEPSDPAADAALAAVLGPDVVLAADSEVIAMDQAVQTSRIEPLSAFTAKGARAGITSLDLDADGAVRRLPPVIGSFAGQMLSAAGVAVPTVPANAQMQVFGGPRSYPTVSYYQALEPETFLPPGALRGKPVLVGFSLKAAPAPASGASDAFATAFTPATHALTAGVELHATLMDNLSHGLWIRPAARPAVLAAILAVALVAAGFGRVGLGAGGWRAFAASATGLVLVLAGSWLLLRLGRLWLPPVAPAVAGLLALGGRVGLDYTRERLLRRRVAEAFARYVTPDLVAEIARNPQALKLGGERRELTILFCDVRGFTSLSEQLKDEPERLTSIINRLLDVLSAEVLAARGTIDKYMGDCVMAFWNAPLPSPDHSVRAVGAALAMIEAVDRLNETLQGEDPSLPPLAVGVGVNTGTCVVGNIGSRWRYDYSVLGDAVNLASRLEGLTKTYGVPIIVGAEIARMVEGRFVLRELDRIAVRGRREATPVYTVAPQATRPISRR